ncbi:MAG: hypothetical protein ACLFNC_04880 [Halodesulfurarchaeum sp.]
MSDSGPIHSRILSFSLLIGVGLTVIGGIFSLAMASLSASFHYAPIRVLSLPALPEGFSLSLSITGLATEADLHSWAWGLVTDALYLGTFTGYYLGLGVVALGGAIVFIGWLSTQQDRSAELLKQLLEQRWFQGTLVLLVVAAVVAANPLLVRLVGAALIVLVVGGAILGATAGSALFIYRRAETPLAVFALYPLLIGIVLLPPAGVALALPSLTAGFQAASFAVAVWLLDNVLAIGGLNDLLRRTFRLEGINYFVMWVAIDVALGWIVGGAVLLARAMGPQAGAEVGE